MLEQHDQAVAAGQDTYIDPQSGAAVFTREALRRRGRCCGCGCRHCPYAHASVPLSLRAQRSQQASWLHQPWEGEAPVDVLFWSGGKDSYLAALALAETSQQPFVLLTTFDAQHRQVAHQEVAIDSVVSQAQWLGLPLLGVPLHGEQDYMTQLEAALALVPNIARLVFGDLHLQHIRQWREQHFTDWSLHFPLWQQPYAELLSRLWSAPARYQISAVNHPDLAHVAIGAEYDHSFVAALPAGIDPLGENGEFHTLSGPL